MDEHADAREDVLTADAPNDAPDTPGTPEIPDADPVGRSATVEAAETAATVETVKPDVRTEPSDTAATADGAKPSRALKPVEAHEDFVMVETSTSVTADGVEPDEASKPVVTREGLVTVEMSESGVWTETAESARSVETIEASVSDETADSAAMAGAAESAKPAKPGGSAEPAESAASAESPWSTIDESVDTQASANAGGRQAAFFDLDKTIIAKSSTLAFGKSFYAGGLINRRTVLRTAYAQFVYLAGGADHDQMERMRQFLSAMCSGWDVEQVKEIVAETLHDLIDPLIYSEAVALIEEHKAAGRDVVIVSTSGAEVVEPIAEMLGADLAVATRMAVDDEGKYTGQIEFYAYAENKAKAVQELAVERGYDLANSYAYSDSATDVPMLESVGNPFAVNPDRALRREAVSREWPVLVFTKPIALRSRLGQRVAEMEIPSKPAITVTAASAALATAGAIWFLGTRKERRRRKGGA